MGFHITQQLYNHGAKVYIAARDERAVGDVIRLIEGQQQELEVKGEHTTTITKGKLVFLHLDLSTIQGARDAADKFLEVESRIDILSASFLFFFVIVQRPWGGTIIDIGL